MYLKNIKLTDFRNYESLSIDLSKKINILHGDNAQGKTNFLESIYFLALTKSHRSLSDELLLNNNKENFMVKGDLVLNSGTKKFKIVYKNNDGKQLFIDGEKITKSTDYISNINVIIFYPEDLDIIKGSPGVRRKYFDTQLGQLDKNYAKTLLEYNKILRTRNECLKQESVNHQYIEAIDKYLIDRASVIYIMRNKFVKKINNHIYKIYNNITGDLNLNLIYESNISNDLTKEEIKNQLTIKLKNNYKFDLKNKKTNIGPHLDDFKFILNDNNLKEYGSQGQQRAAILSLKLSEIEIFYQYKNEKPILLLDDVFSELDEIKKKNLLSYINKDLQTIITTTEIETLDKELIKNSNLIKINSGKIIEEGV